jgi:hypothetical protein
LRRKQQIKKTASAVFLFFYARNLPLKDSRRAAKICYQLKQEVEKTKETEKAIRHLNKFHLIFLFKTSNFEKSLHYYC